MWVDQVETGVCWRQVGKGRWGLRRNNSGANKRPPSEVEQFLAPAGVTLLRPATSRSVRRRRGIPVWKNSTKRAPGPMTARGDRVRCSRDPGSNYRTGSSAPRKTRPRCRRRGRSVVSCGAGRQGPVGNYRGKAKVRTESGKSRCSGSQGGLRKREHDGSRIEAPWETVG